MKLFSAIRGLKKSSKKGMSAAEEASLTSHSSASFASRKFKHKKTSEGAPEDQAMPTTNPNLKIAQDFMHETNVYDPNDPQGYIDKLQSFYAEGAQVIAEDGEQYTPEACNALFQLTFESFPDFKMTCTSAKQVGGNPNIISFDGLIAEGTFTGKPYTIVPGVLPALEATGKTCANDEQRVILELKDGKIVKYVVYAMGICTGFAGFYTRAGGSLNPLIEAQKAAAAAKK